MNGVLEDPADLTLATGRVGSTGMGNPGALPANDAVERTKPDPPKQPSALSLMFLYRIFTLRLHGLHEK